MNLSTSTTKSSSTGSTPDGQTIGLCPTVVHPAHSGAGLGCSHDERGLRRPRRQTLDWCLIWVKHTDRQLREERSLCSHACAWGRPVEPRRFEDTSRGTRYRRLIWHRGRMAEGVVVDLLSMMSRGSSIIRENDAADHLRRCAEALVRAASAYEGFGIVAASPQAERVLGAAMMLAPTLHGDSSGPSIVFDVNYASGTLLARAARRLRDGGNDSHLVGIVLNPLTSSGGEIYVAELEHVRVEAKEVPLRQHCQGGVGGVSILAR